MKVFFGQPACRTAEGSELAVIQAPAVWQDYEAERTIDKYDVVPVDDS